MAHQDPEWSEPPPRRKRRGRTVGIVLLVLVLLLAGVLVIADRVGASRAEQEIAKQTASEMKARGISYDGDPRVDIGGFPFLTQVADGVYKKITISVERPRTEEVQLETMTLVAANVRAEASDLLNGRGPVVADTITGTATVGWEAVKTLVELAGLPSGVDPSKLQVNVVNNDVELKLPITLGRVNFTLKATGKITVAEGQVRLQLTNVGSDEVDSPIIRTAIAGFRDRLVATIKVPQMPYKLVIKKVETTATGVFVTAVADKVQLAA